MKKRTFIKTLLGGSMSIASGSAFIGCQSPTTPKSNPVEASKTTASLPDYWVWMRPNIEWTNDQWKSTFDQIRQSGIQAILPQVYASNDTLFDHPTLPVKQRWLEKILPLAHAAGLQVHAWMWTMPLNNEELVKKHGDWFSVNRKGERADTNPAYVPYYKFLCPCHPEVQEFVAGNVEALGKIEDLDGIHLDYVRQPDVILAEALQPKYDIVQDKEYPEYDYPYSDRCRALFKAQSGIDPMDLGAEAPAHEAWRQFRYDAVSNVVNNFCVPMARKYNKPITAAVFPNWESVRQQWHRWDLDGFLPMLYQGFYNQDIPWIGSEVRKALQRLGDKKRGVYSGLFLPHLKEAGALEEACAVAREAGAKGFSLFGLGDMRAQDWEAVKRITAV